IYRCGCGCDNSSTSFPRDLARTAFYRLIDLACAVSVHSLSSCHSPRGLTGSPSDDFVQKGSVGKEILEVDRTAHEKRVADRVLQMAMRTFDRAVLVRDATVVARRLHAVMQAQRIIPASQIV